MAPVVQTCNPSYWGGRDHEDPDILSQKKPITKKKGWWSGSKGKERLPSKREALRSNHIRISTGINKKFKRKENKTKILPLWILLFFCGTGGVWTQGFTFARQALCHLSYISRLFCSGYFGNGVSLNYFPGAGLEPQSYVLLWP
jgi:hypothetical protein